MKVIVHLYVSDDSNKLQRVKYTCTQRVTIVLPRYIKTNSFHNIAKNKDKCKDTT